MKNLILIFLLLLVEQSAFSQSKMTYAEVDQQTYDLYMQKQWKPLLKVAKQAKEQNISFYYLDYRMGIAYYKLKNYRKAIPFFKEVLEQFPADNLGLEYLFYAYLGAGYFEDARALWLSFDTDFQNKIPFYNKELILNGVGIELKNFQNTDYQQTVSDGNTLEQRINTNMSFFGLNLTHLTNGSFSLFHSLSFMNIKDNVYDSQYADLIDENIKQTEYYALGNIHLSEKTDLKLGLHLLNDYIVGTGELSTASGSALSGGTSSFLQTYYSFNTFNLVVFAAYEKGIANFNIKASTSISNLDNEFQVQPSLALLYFPFGNKNFSLGAECFYQFSTYAGNNQHHVINKQELNFKITKRLRANTFFLYGKVNEFVDKNAVMVYNDIDNINYSLGGSLSLRLGKKTYLYSIYQYYSRENEYTINSNNYTINYNSQTILGGISWNF